MLLCICITMSPARRFLWPATQQLSAILRSEKRWGSGSIIGAGAVITEGKEIPPDSVVVGVPGKIVRQTGADQHQHILNNAVSYVELAREYAHHEECCSHRS